MKQRASRERPCREAGGWQVVDTSALTAVAAVPASRQERNGTTASHAAPSPLPAMLHPPHGQPCCTRPTASPAHLSIGLAGAGDDVQQGGGLGHPAHAGGCRCTPTDVGHVVHCTRAEHGQQRGWDELPLGWGTCLFEPQPQQQPSGSQPTCYGVLKHHVVVLGDHEVMEEGKALQLEGPLVDDVELCGRRRE